MLFGYTKNTVHECLKKPNANFSSGSPGEQNHARKVNKLSLRVVKIDKHANPQYVKPWEIYSSISSLFTQSYHIQKIMVAFIVDMIEWLYYAD